MSEQDSQEVVRSCLDDEADVGVGVKLDAPPAIESWCIVSDPLLVVLPVTHALADERSIAFSQALSYRLIGVHPGGSLDLGSDARGVGIECVSTCRSRGWPTIYKPKSHNYM